MKKILTITSASLLCFTLNAQNQDPYVFMNYNRDIFETCAVIFVVGMFMFFIMAVMKKIFEHRLKNKNGSQYSQVSESDLPE